MGIGIKPTTENEIVMVINHREPNMTTLLDAIDYGEALLDDFMISPGTKRKTHATTALV